MKITRLLILAFTMSLNMVFAQGNIKSNDTTSYLEFPKIQVVPIKDTKNDRQYELYIKLPEGYSENVYVKYPVLYFTDALWHIEILSGSVDYILKDAILVGISWEKDLKGDLASLGAHASRFRDFSIQPLDNPQAQARYQLGQANNHLDFIRNDVIKYIENNYRTIPDNRSYFGYSAGGKFGLYTLLTQPSTFKNYILGSPSLSGGRDIPVLSKLGASKILNANVFISYGDLETETSSFTDKIIAMLKNKNAEGLLLSHEVIDGNHETAFPMTGVQSMKWLSQRVSKENDYPLLTGPYFGQKLPGVTPEIFAPDIVSLRKRTESAVSFSPDLDEMYFSAREDGNWSIYFSKLENGKWTDLEKANFTKGKRSAESKPFVNLNGKRIYFEDDGGKVWYVNRLKDSWGDATPLDLPINDDSVFNLIEAKNGDLYFFNTSKRKQYYAPNKNGKFPEAKEVDIEFGTHCFISPSQDYLVVDARNEDRDNKLDLYVYFKKKDGTWSKPFDLGEEINSNFHDSNPRISPDGKYLFFTKTTQDDDTGSIYWVSTEVIYKLKPGGL